MVVSRQSAPWGWIAWSVVMTASVGVALKAPAYVRTETSGEAIATLGKAVGAVHFRQDGIALWLDAVVDQPFVDGTVIATGAGARAEVAFLDGRALELDENSQIVLRKNAEDGDDSVVTLLKGSLRAPTVARQGDASRPRQEPRRLVINSGDKSVALENDGDGVAVTKTIGQAAPDLKTLSGAPTLAAPVKVALRSTTPQLAPARLLVQELPARAPEPPVAPAVAALSGRPDKPTTTTAADPAVEALGDRPAPLETLPEPASEVEPPSLPAQTPKPKATPKPQAEPKLPAEVKAPRVVAPRVLWASGGLEAKTLPPVVVALAVDQKATPTQALARTRVEAVSGSGAVLGSVSVTKEKGRYVAAVSPALLLGKSDGVELRAAVPADPDGAYQAAASKGETVRIQGLGALPAGPVSLYVETFRPAATSAGWISQLRSVNSDKASVGVHLKQSSDAPALAALLRGSDGAFSVAPGTTAGASGTTIVRGKAAVARVQPGSPTAVRWVRKALRGDVAFQGPASAYVGTGALVAAAASGVTLDGAKPLHVYDDGGRRADLNPSLFNKHPVAWSVVAALGKAVFSSPVTLVDPPAAPALELGDPAAWLKDRRGRPVSQGVPLPMPARVVFVEGASAKGEPRFRAVDGAALGRLVPFGTASARDSSFASKLNAPASAPEKAPEPADGHAAVIRRALALGDADAVVWCPFGAKTWRVERLVDGKVRVVGSAPAPASKAVKDVAGWMVAALGLDGRVLGGGDGYLYALAKTAPKVGAQGVLIQGDGAGKDVAVGLVEATATSGLGTAVRVLLPGNLALPSGTIRIVWE